MANSRLWILGAADPEMAAIEQLLVGAGERVTYATVGGNRVHPGNAYWAEWLEGDYAGRIDRVFLVECDGPALRAFAIDERAVVAICDHHREGDPGFGRPPEEFLPASSIGQVVRLLCLTPGIGATKCLPTAAVYAARGFAGGYIP